MIEHEYRCGVDLGAFLFLTLAIVPPMFVAVYSALSGDLAGIGAGLLLEALSATILVVPLLYARYVLTDRALVVRYWRTLEIPYGEITDVRRVDGAYKIGLSGFGYYCTNFRHRVLVRAAGRDVVLSPDDVDIFVLELRENTARTRAG
jgi:hypothetical protein